MENLVHLVFSVVNGVMINIVYGAEPAASMELYFTKCLVPNHISSQKQHWNANRLDRSPGTEKLCCH